MTALGPAMLGLYRLAGKLPEVIGPLLYGGIILAMDPGRNGPFTYQVAILSLLGLMVIGYLIVRSVPEGTDPTDEEAAAGAPIEPGIVPPGEAPA
jgi:hypothetical protein